MHAPEVVEASDPTPEVSIGFRSFFSHIFPAAKAANALDTILPSKQKRKWFMR